MSFLQTTPSGHGTDVHERPFHMFHMAVMVTPYLAASALMVSPSWIRRRINWTSSFVSFARWCSSALRWQKTPRFLANMSRLLSPFVPKNKWSGRTHAGLSQRWHTHSSSSNAPYVIRYEYRCASSTAGLVPPNAPYPVRFLAANHSQHPSPLRTFVQKRSTVTASTPTKCLRINRNITSLKPKRKNALGD